MKPLKLLGLVALLLAASLAGLIAAQGEATRASRATTSCKTFRAAVGDTVTKLDLTKVVICHTVPAHIRIVGGRVVPSDVTVRFKATLAGNGQLKPKAERSVEFWLNTDRNLTTGDPHAMGADYVLDWTATGAKTPDVSLSRWNGATKPFARTRAKVRASRHGDVVELAVRSSGLGHPVGFRFYVNALMTDSTGAWMVVDQAPEGNTSTWLYTLGGTAGT
jgi:hypothetical protein